MLNLYEHEFAIDYIRGCTVLTFPSVKFLTQHTYARLAYRQGITLYVMTLACQARLTQGCMNVKTTFKLKVLGQVFFCVYGALC